MRRWAGSITDTVAGSRPNFFGDERLVSFSSTEFGVQASSRRNTRSLYRVILVTLRRALFPIAAAVPG